MAKRSPSSLNLLLAVDKPVGITSHDVVSRVRRSLNERRVGHAGTLDPLASGVVVIGVGQATRLLGQLALDRKAYLADIAFGAQTTTDDAEGEVVRRVEVPAALEDPARAREALNGLLGPSNQVPPAYSAISVNGVRSYRRARAGEEVVLPARPIEVYSAELISITGDADAGSLHWTVSFVVSKGTYIRSLARDLGVRLGSAAHLGGLRRTASGAIGLSSCVALDDLDVACARRRALDPVAALGRSARLVAGEELAAVRDGRAIFLGSRLPGIAGEPPLVDGEPVALICDAGLVALAHREDAGSGPRLVMDAVFPQPIVCGVPAAAGCQTACRDAVS